MRHDVADWMRSARGKLAAGELTAADLSAVEGLLKTPRQSVLYLYSKSTNMRSGIASWALFDPTAPHEPKLPEDEPPYASVVAAMADGWRVVQFPTPTLYEYTELDNRYLGYEFVLERLT
ncbi:MAG: hypothetical protein ABGY41_07725 [Candidatus Poribacteria bacterium]